MNCHQGRAAAWTGNLIQHVHAARPKAAQKRRLAESLFLLSSGPARTGSRAAQRRATPRLAWEVSVLCPFATRRRVASGAGIERVFNESEVRRALHAGARARTALHYCTACTQPARRHGGHGRSRSTACARSALNVIGINQPKVIASLTAETC